MYKLFLILALVFVMGCQSEETAVSSDNYSDPTPIPKSRYDGPKPEPGTGNVYGQVMWSGSGAAGLDVLLCQDYSSFSGCGSGEITAVTDKTGAYLLANVQPGTYALSIRVFNSDNWLTINDGILSSAEFEVQDGKTLIIDTQSIFKLDLQPLEPGNQAQVKSGSTTLNWEIYPDAAYYEIYLTPEKGKTIFVSERVDTPLVIADLPPVNCNYRWSLEAFNDDGIKISETDDYVRFQVVGEQASCVLTIHEPVDDSTIPAQDIVLNWEPQPLAVSYKILMWDDTDPDRTHILDFVTVTESQFSFNGALTPDHRYVWSIYAYDNEGIEIAASDIYDFTVRP